MGHYASEMDSASAEVERQAKRERQLRAKLDRTPLRAFTVAELPVLLAFLGFKGSRHIFLPNAIALLEKKLKAMKKKKRKRK